MSPWINCLVSLLLDVILLHLLPSFEHGGPTGLPYGKIARCPYFCAETTLVLSKIYLQHKLHDKQYDWAPVELVC